MIKRINYTDRRRIPHRNIKIVTTRFDGKIRSFNVEFKLEEFSFPPDARLAVEAYHRTERKRFEWGTVANPQPPSDTDLSEFIYQDSVQFRLKVVNENGQLLGHADRISLISESQKTILPVRFEDLDNLIWKLTEEVNGLCLILNNRIPNIQYHALNNPVFRYLVYPQVFKEILLYLYFDGIEDSDGETAVEWHKDWVKFVKQISPNTEFPSIDIDNSTFDKNLFLGWIENVTSDFIIKIKSEWNKFIEYFSRNV